MRKIKVIIIDDHYVVRDGIKVLLLDIEDIVVLGEASNGVELFEILKTKDPDILILDLIMPGISGIEIIEKLNENYPDIKVIAFSSNSDADSVFDSISAGALGYLPKSTNREELIEAIYMVYKGNQFLSQSISTTVLMDCIKRDRIDEKKAKARAKAKEKKVVLTPRELEVVKLFSEGFSYKKIAKHLHISVRTVEAHKNNIMDKLELESTVELVKYALRNNIIEL